MSMCKRFYFLSFAPLPSPNHLKDMLHSLSLSTSWVDWQIWFHFWPFLWKKKKGENVFVCQLQRSADRGWTSSVYIVTGYGERIKCPLQALKLFRQEVSTWVHIARCIYCNVTKWCRSGGKYNLDDHRPYELHRPSILAQKQLQKPINTTKPFCWVLCTKVYCLTISFELFF